MSEILKRLGLELKLIRTEAGVKQKTLARKMDLPAPLLSMYEKGVREPPLEFLDAYAKNFKMSLSYIFLRMEKPPLKAEKKKKEVVMKYTFHSNASSPDKESNAMASIKKDGVVIVSGNGKEAHEFLRKALKALEPSAWEHSYDGNGICTKCGMSEGYAKSFRRPCER